MDKLTSQQIEKQDFIDNEIFKLLQKLIPQPKAINWDIEIIGAIRDSILKVIVNKLAINDKKFYPYLKI